MLAVQRLARTFASEASFSAATTPTYRVFDRIAKRKQRDCAASRDGGKQSRTVDYVRDEVADRMMERLLDIKRKFGTIVDLGSGPGHFSKLLEPNKAHNVIMLDSSEQTLNRDPDDEFEVRLQRVQGDEEKLLEILPRNSQEAIVSCLSLHWVNDLPGVLFQIQQALKPDGLFLGAILGGDTLFELRSALQLAEVEREGGISPHVSPMTDTKDISNLLNRAGFTLLTVDTDEVRVGYPSMWELIEDLRDMGEGNAILGRRHFMHRDTLAAASAIYQGNGYALDLRIRIHPPTHRATRQRRWFNSGDIPSDLHDWLETLCKPTKASRTWFCAGQSQRCLLGPDIDNHFAKTDKLSEWLSCCPTPSNLTLVKNSS